MIEGAVITESSATTRTSRAFLASAQTSSEIEVGLLTGGGDKPYAFGLAMALVSRGVGVDFIGSNEIDCPELHSSPRLRFLNLRGSQREDASFTAKTLRILACYARLIAYASLARPKIFHILWNIRFQLFDRTLLMLYYKLLGKRIALTAHNINAGKRDGNDSALNRLTLRIQYRLADHIFVHSDAMKIELRDDFDVPEERITVVHIGVNNSVPDTDLTPASAKRQLGIGSGDRTILFFGHIGPYKGLEFLIAAFHLLIAKHPDYRLLIVGKPKRGCENYVAQIQQAIRDGVGRERIMQRIEFIPDEETEMYFKAADVLALPYTQVFQSGVLVLGYTFGLPVVAADVGSFRSEVIEGATGFVCNSCDSLDLARAIETYFGSDLFRGLDSRRQKIRDYANTRYSWDVVADITRNVYTELSGSHAEIAGVDTPR